MCAIDDANRIVDSTISGTEPHRSDESAREYLRALGPIDDSAIDLAEAALRLAVLRQPDAPVAPSREFLKLLVADVAAHDAGGDGSPESRAESLRQVIAVERGITGDRETYDDLRNASLVRVLDRRKGLPITLSILYLHAARALGWTAHGLGFPGHFLIALDGAGRRLVLDPFNDGATCDAQTLRNLAKTMLGSHAELLPEHYDAVGNRAILARLQANIRARLIQKGAYQEALTATQAVTWFSPHDATAWQDMGIINAELGNLRTAVQSLEESLAWDDRPSRRHVTAALIQRLRTTLN